MRAAGVLLKLAKLAVVVYALTIADAYVAQQRFEQAGMVPCDYGVCVLNFDKLENHLFWTIAPERPTQDGITGQLRHAPKEPS